MNPMTDEQSRALLNTIMSGFTELIKTISTNSSDHDTSIRMETKLDLVIEEIKRNHKEFIAHKIESVPVRDDVRELKAAMNVCAAEKRGQMLSRHDNWIKSMSKAMWIIAAAAVAALSRTIWWK